MDCICGSLGGLSDLLCMYDVDICPPLDLHGLSRYVSGSHLSKQSSTHSLGRNAVSKNASVDLHGLFSWASPGGPSDLLSMYMWHAYSLSVSVKCSLHQLCMLPLAFMNSLYVSV